MNLNNTDYKLTMYKKYIIGLFTLCCAGNAAAQSLAQAKQLFLNGEFEQAKPAFQKLVKQAPSNANYNYWYGACCYETGEKKEAQPYLEKSAARKVIDAYRYLGKLYYDIYRFDDAVDNYEQHIEWLEKKKRPTEMAEAELEQIKHALYDHTNVLHSAQKYVRVSYIRHIFYINSLIRHYGSSKNRKCRILSTSYFYFSD